MPTQSSSTNKEAIQKEYSEVDCATTSDTNPSTCELEFSQILAVDFGQSTDIGNFIAFSSIQDKQKYDLLRMPYKPPATYNFRQDVGPNKRPFIYKWLDQYEWMVYSRVLKGALCKYCVIFPPSVTHGSTLGAFIKRPFIKYKDLHMQAKNHASSAWHKDSTIRVKNFIDVLSNEKPDILSLIDEGKKKSVAENRKKILPIIKTIVFCGTHDMPIRESNKNSGNFSDLLKFRVDTGDKDLENHLFNAAGNSKYTSHRIQNEVISIAGHIIMTNIVEEANSSKYFSVIADESADISGHEQLSIGIRYVHEQNEDFTVKEEFLGFVQLNKLNADCIAASILEFLEKSGLNLDKLVAQGYDGCSTMAGEIHGVQRS
ncbi:52 kDa repressor of the inhibitor of the protein kinase-like [Harmonia axyridis]|uniref:52 kDa repressor of the inhibitor of the protein kinase-like n=1 Tax=Harmonia axyridis TaxID=115357 RepID=UPI001E278D7C|nr:52 kDa repressor of the inhibitor of the protein kinase-like [Harmonia axyridis]